MGPVKEKNPSSIIIKTMILARASLFMLGLFLIMNIYPTYGGPIDPDDRATVADVNNGGDNDDYRIAYDYAAGPRKYGRQCTLKDRLVPRVIGSTWSESECRFISRW